MDARLFGIEMSRILIERDIELTTAAIKQRNMHVARNDLRVLVLSMLNYQHETGCDMWSIPGFAASVNLLGDIVKIEAEMRDDPCDDEEDIPFVV